MKNRATSFYRLLPKSSFKLGIPLPLAIPLWASLLVAGFFLLTDYGVRPAAIGSVPATWPKGSQLAKSTTGMTLVMFVHPHCPCSAASVSELARIIENHLSNVDVHVLFLRPGDVSERWVRTALWSNAAQIPNVKVREDFDGLEAARFGVKTSGHLVIYDKLGHLVFSGGITSARGHYGANKASKSMTSILQGDNGIAQTSVFGCPLQNIGQSCCENKSE